MSLVAWIVIGLLAGGLARFVVRDDRGGCGCIYTLVVGVLGALIGGALLRAAGVREDDDWGFGASLLTATLGAVLLLLVLQAIGSRGRPR